MLPCTCGPLTVDRICKAFCQCRAMQLKVISSCLSQRPGSDTQALLLVGPKGRLASFEGSSAHRAHGSNVNPMLCRWEKWITPGKGLGDVDALVLPPGMAGPHSSHPPSDRSSPLPLVDQLRSWLHPEAPGPGFGASSSGSDLGNYEHTDRHTGAFQAPSAPCESSFA